MADLESVLADVSYLMTIEKSRSPNAKTLKKITLPDASVHNVIHKHLLLRNELDFEKIYSQRMGSHFLAKFMPSTCPLFSFLKGILEYERTLSVAVRLRRSKELYDKFIYAEMLAMDSKMPKEVTDEISATLKSATYPRDLFQPCKPHLYQALTEKYMSGFLLSPYYVRYCQWKYLELDVPHQISLNDFSVHRIIGRGGFGEVYGARKDDSGRMFALKLLDKKRIKAKKGEILAVNERNMLAKISSPFVVNLYYAFQTNDKLCFILDLMNGGDLHYHLTQHGVFNEDEVRFYAAEMILALEHIHQKCIVYRDLKPSNVLLDEEGHIRISDLGLACEYTDRKPSSSVGTHGYMAPEVIKKGVQYDFTADWFSLGCVLYKLLRGHSPFRSQNKDEVDHMTLTKEVHIPSAVSPEMSILLSGLLEKDISKRLGCMGRGAEELKELAFFKDVNWDSYMEKKVSPPLIPPKGEVNAADAFDIGSFDSDDTRGVRLTEDDQKTYSKFNIIVSERWQAEMMEGVFEAVNNERDKAEAKEQAKLSKSGKVLYSPDMIEGEVVLQGYGYKQTTTAMISHWKRQYMMLYPNRIELGDSLLWFGYMYLEGYVYWLLVKHCMLCYAAFWSSQEEWLCLPLQMLALEAQPGQFIRHSQWPQYKDQQMSKASCLAFDGSVLVENKQLKGTEVLRIQPIGSRKEFIFKFDTRLDHYIWYRSLRDTVHKAESKTVSASGIMMADSGGLLVSRRQHRAASPSTDTGGDKKILSHTKSVPVL